MGAGRTARAATNSDKENDMSCRRCRAKRKSAVALMAMAGGLAAALLAVGTAATQSISTEAQRLRPTTPGPTMDPGPAQGGPTKPSGLSVPPGQGPNSSWSWGQPQQKNVGPATESANTPKGSIKRSVGKPKYEELILK